MNRSGFLCLAATISVASAADGQEKELQNVRAGQGSPNVSSASAPLAVSSTLFQSAGDLRAASESLERFGKSLEKTATEFGGTADAVAEHLAQASSGFDPLGLQSAFKAIQQQTEVIRQQQEVIYRLQQNEIQRLKRQNQQLNAGRKSARSPARQGKKKRNTQ